MSRVRIIIKKNICNHTTAPPAGRINGSCRGAKAKEGKRLTGRASYRKEQLHVMHVVETAAKHTVTVHYLSLNGILRRYFRFNLTKHCYKRCLIVVEVSHRL